MTLVGFKARNHPQQAIMHGANPSGDDRATTPETFAPLNERFTEEEKKALKDSMASLKLGEAWVWEPGAEPPIFERVQIRKRETFNSSATPKSGERRTEPRKLAAVDLEALRGKIADTIERAKADDPKELKKEIAGLKRDLKAAKQETPEPKIETVEIPVLANGKVDELKAAVAAIREAASSLDTVAANIGAELAAATQERQPPRPAPRRAAAREQRPSTPKTPTSTSADGDDLKRAERKVLGVLAQFPTGRTKVQIAILTGYSAKSGGFNNALGRLRSLGLISPAGADPIYATDEGIASVGEVDPVPMGVELLNHWLGKLKKAERAILEVLYDAHPAGLTKDEIAEQTGYSGGSGGFNNALGRLRSLELAVGYGEVQASDDFFQDSSPSPLGRSK